MNKSFIIKFCTVDDERCQTVYVHDSTTLDEHQLAEIMLEGFRRVNESTHEAAP